MTESIIVAMITAGLSLIGVIITVISGYSKTVKTVKAQTDLTLYRVEQLEIKQDKHNTLIDRMYKAEDKIDVIEEKICVANNRIKVIEEEIRNED